MSGSQADPVWLPLVFLAMPVVALTLIVVEEMVVDRWRNRRR